MTLFINIKLNYKRNMKPLVTISMLLLLIFSCKKQNTFNKPADIVPRTVDQDPSLPSISVNGSMLHSEAFGHPDSALIVVIHGGPGSDYRYLLNCKEFANHGYRVVFYDQRGSGLSQRFPGESYNSVLIMYDELDAVINYYKKKPNQKVFLLGHSWGGILATGFAANHPDQINGLIICEPGGLKWQDIVTYVANSKKRPFTSEALNDAAYVDQFITAKNNEHEKLDFKAFLVSSFDDKQSAIGNEDRLPVWRLGAVVSDALFQIGENDKPDFTINLSQFTKKVLFVYSENNRAYGDTWAQKVSSAFKNVELFKTLGAGHDMLSFPTGWNNTFPAMLNYYNSLK